MANDADEQNCCSSVSGDVCRAVSFLLHAVGRLGYVSAYPRHRKAQGRVGRGCRFELSKGLCCLWEECAVFCVVPQHLCASAYHSDGQQTTALPIILLQVTM